MKLLIIDPRNGDNFADLFILEPGMQEFKKQQLGYVPELHYDKANHQIVLVETELGKKNGDKTSYWLKCFSADNLELLLQKETPARPMYAGFPGRSNHVKSSISGRYLYFLETTIHPEIIDLYRLLVHRYDYEKDEIESGSIKVDSCLIDFDQFGENEDELCFHLSCEHPSVVALSEFNSPELNLVQLENLPSRTHGPKETCGSWISKDKKTLFCINGEGTIYKVNSSSQNSEKVTRLKLKNENSIPLQQIYGAKDSLLIGVSEDINVRSLSLASQLWRISADKGELINKIDLPFPIMNFITTPDDYLIIGVSPYAKAICFIELETGKTLGIRDEIGISPAEVLAIP